MTVLNISIGINVKHKYKTGNWKSQETTTEILVMKKKTNASHRELPRHAQ